MACIITLTTLGVLTFNTHVRNLRNGCYVNATATKSSFLETMYIWLNILSILLVIRNVITTYYFDKLRTVIKTNMQEMKMSCIQNMETAAMINYSNWHLKNHIFGIFYVLFDVCIDSLETVITIL